MRPAIPCLFLLGCQPVDASVDTDTSHWLPDTEESTTPPDDTSGPIPPETLSHDAHIQPIWDASCGGCHLNGNASGGLNLDDAYDDLVGVASDDVPTMSRVAPGEPDASYVWHKLVGTHRDVGGAGAQMPLNSALAQGDLDLVEAWILDGANP